MTKEPASQGLPSGLTSPTLNSIYEEDLLKEGPDNDLYLDLDADIQHAPKVAAPLSPTPLPLTLLKLVLLGAAGVVAGTVSQHVWLAATPLDFVDAVVLKLAGTPVPWAVVCFAAGIALSFAQPVVDRALPPAFSRKLFRFARSPGTASPLAEALLVVRAAMVLLGILYGLRAVPWQSELQALVAFVLLDPCVWLLLDSTLSGLFACAGLAVVVAWDSELAAGLSRGSFFFCLLIVFGKLGRVLWG